MIDTNQVVYIWVFRRSHRSGRSLTQNLSLIILEIADTPSHTTLNEIVLLGGIATFLGSPVIRPLLYETSPRAPVTYGIVTATLLAVAKRTRRA